VSRTRLPQPMSENDKDWTNPAFTKIYIALAMADQQEPGDELPNWLNANGFANLTCCPECHVDDFVHVEGCTLGNRLDEAAKLLETFNTTNAAALPQSLTLPTPGSQTKKESS